MSNPEIRDPNNFAKHKAILNLVEAKRLQQRSEIEVGQVYEHCDGGQYQIEGIVSLHVIPTEDDVDNEVVFNDATGYEQTGKVGKLRIVDSGGALAQEYIAYTQLHDGGFKKGTLWLRKKSDFQSNFDLV